MFNSGHHLRDTTLTQLKEFGQTKYGHADYQREIKEWLDRIKNNLLGFTDLKVDRVVKYAEFLFKEIRLKDDEIFQLEGKVKKLKEEIKELKEEVKELEEGEKEV